MNREMGPEIIEKSRYSGNIAELYSRLAPLYDLFTAHDLAHHQEAIGMAEIQQGDQVLEVACGTGRATVEIAKRLGDGGKLCALDLTEAMLNRARHKLAKHGLLDRVNLRQGDARTLPYAEGTFDIIYNAFMFDLIDLPEIPDIVAEFNRVLKPGGKLVLVAMSKEKQGKTLYETLYEKGLLGFASGSCRPVLMKPFLEGAGFEGVRRIYRRNRSWFFLTSLTGTEIVIGRKPRP